jgi:putative DNA primase/helicase
MNTPALHLLSDAADSVSRPDTESAASPAKKKNKILPTTKIKDFLQMNFPPRKNLFGDWLPSQGIAMIHAYRGVGKTHISVGVAAAVATGGTFLNWAAERPAGVLYIDGEMPAVVLQERFAAAICGMNMPDVGDNTPLYIITPDLLEDNVPDLSTTKGQREINKVLTDDIELIIVDNLSTLCSSIEENNGDSWVIVQQWARQQRKAGRTVLFVHHDNKTGQQRGSSRREDILDTVIQLRRPADYNPADGAVFEIHFRKSRGLYGDSVRPILTALRVDPAGCPIWTTTKLEESNQAKVRRLIDAGAKQSDIAKALGLSPGYVSKLAQRRE